MKKIIILLFLTVGILQAETVEYNDVGTILKNLDPVMHQYAEQFSTKFFRSPDHTLLFSPEEQQLLLNVLFFAGSRAACRMNIIQMSRQLIHSALQIKNNAEKLVEDTDLFKTVSELATAIEQNSKLEDACIKGLNSLIDQAMQKENLEQFLQEITTDVTLFVREYCVKNNSLIDKCFQDSCNSLKSCEQDLQDVSRHLESLIPESWDNGELLANTVDKTPDIRLHIEHTQNELYNAGIYLQGMHEHVSWKGTMLFQLYYMVTYCSMEMQKLPKSYFKSLVEMPADILPDGYLLRPQIVIEQNNADDVPEQTN